MTVLIDKEKLIHDLIQILHDDVCAPNGHLDPYYVFKVIKEQPSAQPEPCEDVVKRADVVDMLEMYPFTEYGEYETAREVVKRLPSAQPERTCVNCGRTANNGGWYADGRTRCPIEEHYALPKNGYCHLWEKRNVTDDNYPERREE